MDRPDQSSDLPHRSGSPEPSLSRPKPFDEDDTASRKRRRTSGSVDSLTSNPHETDPDPDNASTTSTTIDDEDHPGPNSVLRHPDTAQPNSSHSTSGPPSCSLSSPRPSSSSSDIDVAEPVSATSNITVTLRKDPAATRMGSSSLKPADPSDIMLDLRRHARHAAQRRVALIQSISQSDMYSQSPSSSIPPPVELVPESDDDLLPELLEEELSALGHHPYIQDPTGSFPYKDSQEPLFETANRLTNYFSAQSSPEISIIEDVENWMANFLVFARTGSLEQVALSLRSNQTFWRIFPGVILPMIRLPLHKIPAYADVASRFYRTFIELTSFIVKFDVQTISDLPPAASPGSLPPPLLFSAPFLTQSHVLVQSEPRTDAVTIPPGGDGQDTPLDGIAALMGTFESCLAGDGFTPLAELATGLVSILPHFPRLVDNLGPVAQMLSDILDDSWNNMQNSPSDAQYLIGTRRLEEAHELWINMSTCLSTLMEKQVTQLTNDGVSGAIIALSGVLKLCLLGPHTQATQMIEEYCKNHPGFASTWAPEAISFQWRFDMLTSLVRCSQMQLRVTGVTTLCNELVGAWKRLGEDPANPILSHMAAYLLRSNLIEYLLGPNSHPEIIIECANVVGFLVVTKTYRQEHTDRLWQAVLSSQDSRFSDALLRMITSILSLLDYEPMSYLCEKLEDVPITSFNPSLRTLWENLMHQMLEKFRSSNSHLTYQPYSLCLRLLRQSSVSVNGQPSHQEMQQMATQRLSKLLEFGPDTADREKLYQSCLEDVSQKTPTALGSLWFLYMIIRSNVASEIQILAQKHDLVRLLVEELEHAVKPGAATGTVSVFCGTANHPRREFITNILRHQPAAITDDLGQKLWDILVGTRSLCTEDREAGWKIINGIRADSQPKNPFVRACLSTYLPALPVSCFCDGTLEFVRCEAVFLVRMDEDFQLDNDATVRSSCLEQLWRLILGPPDANLAFRAMGIMAVELYMNKDMMLAHQTPRMRKVHSYLVKRCFQQLKESADRIRASHGGEEAGAPGDTEISESTEDDVTVQERIFTRSLQLLRYFLDAYQSNPELSAPDLRAVMSQVPSEINGDLAQLKYQSFDGMLQTDIRPLRIGMRNTAGSLLASIRQETGFPNYRAYYRGRPFHLSEDDISKSLDELQINEGLILVKKEKEDERPASPNCRPGASSLQIEIMSHFPELWDYLSLKNWKPNLAQEIYEFLARLPAETGVMESFQKDAMSYRDIFPPDELFRSMYVVHAIFEYKKLARQSRRLSGVTKTGPEVSLDDPYSRARERALSLAVQALSDPEVTHASSNQNLRLSGLFMHMLVYWLQDADLVRVPFSAASIGLKSHKGLLRVLVDSMKLTDDSAWGLTFNTLSVLLILGLLDKIFWKSLAADEEFATAVGALLLFDSRRHARYSVVKLTQDISEKQDRLAEELAAQETPPKEMTDDDDDKEAVRPIARYFWDLALDLLPNVLELPGHCHELFSVLYNLTYKVLYKSPSDMDLEALAVQTSKFLIQHEPAEEIHQAEFFDPIPRGMVSLLHMCLQLEPSIVESDLLQKDLAYELFWHLLFPKLREASDDPVPKVTLNPETRAKVYEVIVRLVKNDRAKFTAVLNSMIEVVPFSTIDEEDPYLYDIPYSFDRSAALKAPCGYVGLRNLSNTCYLNSLMTQLYMNTSFREFIMSTTIRDDDRQEMLRNTKKVFGFMQESYRRYIDPSDFVSSIKTYDNTNIDIHNQMDVDEFYNLLFDRWEGQLVSQLEKSRLRSFYGGQLVQQIKSKECEHISERLEPFSAIQCDVQGKSCLQESLQAYVDGEVLEGDNKYKCSSCDLHVDAVKRACLKDLPDNLIFHLKRFEFNLRTLQRSKINDYFTFPERIDMSPYTAERLNNPDNKQEDIFELTGILVHAGTAESGHYYSYTREGPTAPGRPSWIEFNDDNVTPWDPSQMGAATFGGPDHGQSFDNKSAVYDKPYSAYMLFFSRVSALNKQQLEAQERKTPIPVHAKMDMEQMEYILDENTNLLRRHCVFDARHAIMVQKMFDQAGEFDREVSDRPGSSGEVVQRFTDPAMNMALSYLDQVACRKKELPNLATFMAMLYAGIDNSAENAYALYEYFLIRPGVLRSLVQRNPEQMVRQSSASLFLRALHKISVATPQRYDPEEAMDSMSEDDNQAIANMQGKAALSGTMRIFSYLWKFFHMHIRAWDEHFSLICRFARMGDREVAYILSEDYLLKLCHIIAADPVEELPANYSRMLQNIVRRFSSRPPSYVEIIGLIDYLLKKLSSDLTPESIVEMPEDRLDDQQSPFPWASTELAFMHHHPEGRGYSFFVEKLIGIDQEPHITDSIVTRLALLSQKMDISVCQALMANIRGESGSLPVDSFLRTAAAYVGATPETEHSMQLASHVAMQASQIHTADAPVMVTFFQSALHSDLSDADPTRRLHDHCVELMPKWAPPVLAHPEVVVRTSVYEILDEDLFLFSHDQESWGEDDEGLQQRRLILVQVIQCLGVACLRHLRDTYVRPGIAIAREQAESVIKVVKRCKPYLDLGSGAEQDLPQIFEALQEAVNGPLRQLVVEQVEDDGSGTYMAVDSGDEDEVMS